MNESQIHDSPRRKRSRTEKKQSTPPVKQINRSTTQKKKVGSIDLEKNGHVHIDRGKYIQSAKSVNHKGKRKMKEVKSARKRLSSTNRLVDLAGLAIPEEDESGNIGSVEDDVVKKRRKSQIHQKDKKISFVESEYAVKRRKTYNSNVTISENTDKRYKKVSYSHRDHERSFESSNTSRKETSEDEKKKEPHIKKSVSVSQIVIPNISSPSRNLQKSASAKNKRKSVASLMRREIETEQFPQDFVIQKIQDDGILTYVDDEQVNRIYAGHFFNILLQLLDWLLTDPNRKAIFKLIHIFSVCYKLYYSTEELLDLLFVIWDLGPEKDSSISLQDFQKKNRSAILLFFSGWIEKQYDDLEGESEGKLFAFIDTIEEDHKNLLLSRIESASKPKDKIMIMFKPTVPKAKTGSFSALTVKPSVIAEQWTIMDVESMIKIKKYEFIEPGEHWNDMLNRSVMLTRWVASEIVSTISLSKRIETYKRFVQIAVRFLELKNFNGLMCIWGGLNSVSVNRLHKTIRGLKKQQQNILAAFQTQLSEENNFTKLRSAIEKHLLMNDPIVPWFELVAKQRNWVEHYPNCISLPVETEETVWNFEKIYILGKQILDFEKFQKINEQIDLDYSQCSNGNIRTFLQHLPTYNDEMLYQFSVQCEE